MRSPVVLFDLDGTLTDSGVGIANSVQAALDEIGHGPLDAAALRRFVGPPLLDSFAGLGLPRATCEAAVQAYRRYFTETGLYENAVYDGIEEALDALGDAGVVLGVATSKPEPFARRILEHFGLASRFAVIAGAGLDGTLCHKQEVIAAALEGVGAAAGTVTMVGDREHDVFGAQAHGLPCVGVAWGYAEPGELERAGARPIVSEPAQLVDVLVSR
jgi:phosphoglycolate phosphatase